MLVSRECNKCHKTGNFAYYIIDTKVICQQCSPYSKKEHGKGYIPNYFNKSANAGRPCKLEKSKVEQIAKIIGVHPVTVRRALKIKTNMEKITHMSWETYRAIIRVKEELK